MKISYNWLQTFFATPLPAKDKLEELLTFHSSEIDEVLIVGGDTVYDVKILPDKSAWLMSHRGVAKEISVITGQSLQHDVFLERPELLLQTDRLKITLETPHCDYYSAALVSGVIVGPSPTWLQERLMAIGQRSINNVVDATNYVMFELGQPLHAFDADKLVKVEGQHHIKVRNAKDGESITTLTGDNYTLSETNMLIVDGGNDSPLAIAGIKGGQSALVDSMTKNIILESAHFDRFNVRQTSKTIKLRTDASARYENGIPAGLAPLALPIVVKLICEIASGNLVGYSSCGVIDYARVAVSVSLSKINSTLGVTLSMSEVEDILRNFGYNFVTDGGMVTVTPPWERDDLIVAADLIEEIGRIHGMDKIVSIIPTETKLPAYNPRHYYAEKIRQSLLALGFSEIYTSSFRDKDTVHILNALASDKSYLRSTLHANIRESVIKNVPHRDLLGFSAIKVFEIGTVFAKDSESFHVGLGVQAGTTYKSKIDDELLKEAQSAIETTLGSIITWQGTDEGVSEFSLDALLPLLPEVTEYEPVSKTVPVSYQPFSLYPSVTRDIALWVPVTIDAQIVEELLKKQAGDLCVRVTLFDTFIKEDKTSLAFRLIFQSNEKTLAASEVDKQMMLVYRACSESGWEVR